MTTLESYLFNQVLTAPNHEGTHWVRIEQEKDSKIIFKWVSFNQKNLFIDLKDIILSLYFKLKLQISKIHVI